MVISNNGLKISRHRCFALLAAVAFCNETILNYFTIALERLPIVSAISYFFVPTIFIILIIFSFDSNRLNKIKPLDIGILAFFFIAICLTMVFYPNKDRYIISALTTHILPCLPFFLLGVCFSSDEEVVNTVSLVSCLAVIINVLYLFYFNSTGRSIVGDSGYDYNMYWSYLLLPNTMICINYAFRKKSIIAIICSLVGTVYAFSMGTRGAIAVLGMFYIASILTHIDYKRERKKVCLLIFTIIAAVIFMYSPMYILALNSFRPFLTANGLSTRILDSIIEKEFISNTSGRNEIYSDLWNRLMERPFLGYGIYGEWQFGYYSAHNMYIEALFHFGLVIGSIIILLYVFTFIKALKKTTNFIAKEWLIMFGCLVFIKGIFGGRYMDYPVFFLLGLCLNTLRSQNAKR